ncbi:MAG: hypothetical protein KA534_00085 [Sediminibacterium sp.]|nr:hypothetical protein [Sediminibacterium sp.]MBP6144148.1 hypothetical protein [Sediminibacterium sp.]
MFDKKGNVLDDGFIANFLEVYQKAILLKTFRHAKLHREFALTFYDKFTSFFIELQDSNNKVTFNQIIDLWVNDEQSGENAEGYDSVKNELYPELLNINYLGLVTDDFDNETYLGLYNYLVKSYVSKIQDFWLVDADDHLLYLLQTYLNISIDVKSFDAINHVEPFLFENSKPINALIKKNNFIYLSIVEVYFILDGIEKANNLTNDIFSQMDLLHSSNLTNDDFGKKFYTTNINPADQELKEQIYKQNYTYYFKDQRKEFLDNLKKPKPKWTFSNLEQANNAFRLGLITEQRHNDARKRFKKEHEVQLSLINELPAAFTFLKIDDRFNELSDIECQSPQPTNSHDIDSIEQKIEYYNVFYKIPTLFGIRKFMQLRIERFYDFIIQFGNYDLIDTAIGEEVLFNKIDKSVVPLGRFDNLKNMGQAAFDHSYVQTTILEISIKENNINFIFNVALIDYQSHFKIYRINANSSYQTLFDFVSNVPDFVFDIIMRMKASDPELDDNHKIFLSLSGITIEYTESKKRIEIFYNPESGKEYRTTLTEETIMSNSVDWLAILKRFEVK